MENTWIIIKQIMLMFIYMAIGFSLYKKKLITKEGSKSLAHLLLYVVLPCVVVKSFCVERSSEKIRGLLISMVGAVLLLLAAMLIAHILFRRNPMDNFGAAFSNAGFMGFPLITAVLGADAVFYAAGFVALLNVLQWTYGQSLMANDSSAYSLKAVVGNPLVIAMAAGLLIFFAGIPIPALISSSIHSLAALNAPLAMVILGVYFAQTDFYSIFTNPHLYLVSAVRLILIPLVSIMVGKIFFDKYQEINISLMLAASAPIGSNVAVYAQKLNLDYTYAVKIVCLSTILCMITTPIMMMLL